MGNFLFASIHGYLLYSTLTLIEKWQQGAETKSGTQMTFKHFLREASPKQPPWLLT